MYSDRLVSAPGGNHFKLTAGAPFLPKGTQGEGETESDEEIDVDGDARPIPLLSSLLPEEEEDDDEDDAGDDDGGSASRTTGSLKSTINGPEEPNGSGAGPVRCVR